MVRTSRSHLLSTRGTTLVGLLAALALAACAKDGPACSAGNKGCACQSGNSCNSGLTCMQGRCEVQACTVGDAGCSCFGNDTCNTTASGVQLECQSGICVDSECPPGVTGCACLSGACDDPSATCEDGTCVAPPCPAGTEGCPCSPSGGCGVSTRGEPLTCDGATCRAESCPPGDTGCVCANGNSCSAPGDECVLGFCQPPSCAPGELDCSCLAGSCRPGLLCRDGAICVDNTGYLGGACFADNTCQRGLRCQDDVCAPCVLGSHGCACDSGDSCHAGLVCVADQCLDEHEAPPTTPRCYTPCEQNLVASDGSFRECPVDGLMPGCVGGRTCIEGTCTLPGEAPLSCTTDLDCPMFQACLGGGCYSNCNDSSDCAAGTSCYQHVCRTECDADTDSCKSGTSCVTDDSEHGHCLPVASPGMAASYSVPGTFTLSRGSLEFSNINTTELVTLTNNSPAFANFTVRKRLQVTYPQAGGQSVLDDPANDGVDCNPASDCPLVWIELGPQGAATRVQSYTVGVEGNGGTATIEAAGAGDTSEVRWNGRIEVSHPKMGTQTIVVSYTERPEGRWVGNMYYFAQFGTQKLDEWRASQATRDNFALSTQVGNALVQQWAAFRRGSISWKQLLAALTSVRTDSWRWPNVTRDCPEAPLGACYPFDISALGLVTFTTSMQSNPVPSGVSELPFAANLRMDGSKLTGRIESSLALQYPGNPAISLDFGADAGGNPIDPSVCERTLSGTCLVLVKDLQASIFVGGRYTTDAADTDCAARAGDGYALTQIPWLVPGFARATSTDTATGLPYRYECRDTQLPWGAGSPSSSPELAARNASLAAANPIPDGRTRRRSLRLVDGALVDQTHLFLLFEEVFDSFLPGDTKPFSAYGFVILEREKTDLPEDDANSNGVADVFEGWQPQDTRAEPTNLLNVECSPDLVETVLGYGQDVVTASNADKLAQALIDGVVPEGTPALIDDTSVEAVHYLCTQTGLFDGGSGAVTELFAGGGPPNDDTCGLPPTTTNYYDNNGRCDDGGPNAATSICPLGADVTDCGTRTATDADARVACPAGSDVTFFTVDKSLLSQAGIAALPCQNDGSCQQTLTGWKTSGGPLVQVDPVFRCEDPTAVFCSSDRYDLRAGKQFYAANTYQAVLPPLYSEIELAFRYKTQFRSRTGDSVGFAPQICVPDSNQIPYCYDPPAIEAIRARVDCLLQISDQFYNDLTPEAQTKLNGYLCTNTAYAEACHPLPIGEFMHDGFERLNAELLVMMGDESFTQAFASRFDLAGTHAASFEGSRFEPGGIDLSGQAGHEVAKLYQAAEYYQEALDRFYAISPLLWKALGYGFDGRNFVTPETVTWYFERLIRASTQKARAWSRVAERYQGFNRPDLSRVVVERAYTATYLESIVLSRMMLAIVDTLRPEDKPQVTAVLEEGQRRYRMAMLDLRNVYSSINEKINFFGLPPDYIPFPTLGPVDVNAFRVIISRAKAKAQVAAERENDALASGRSFDTDAEEFQAELVRLRNTYENQLGDICGTFSGTDGRVHPAIESYAYLDDKASKMGDPCGLLGNGSIFSTLSQLEIARAEMQRILVAHQNVLEEVEIERSRVSAQCGVIVSMADYVYKARGVINNLQTAIGTSRWAINRIERTMTAVDTVATLTHSEFAGGAASGAIAIGIATAARALGEVAIAALDASIVSEERNIADIERETARWQMVAECDTALIDSNARTATLLLRLKEIGVEALKAEYQIRLSLGELERQHNLAERLEQEYAEAQEYAVNIMAARNDPNIRIYRNDAYLNADITFDDALREAYRATRVFEYYTSQSYADLQKLFLIRMVQFGDYNLENYLIDLENAFNEFEESYGLPDTRVALLSLRDDILRIPRLDTQGGAISQADRVDMLRARLADPDLIDENGYLAIPFSTTLTSLSPLTRNHKILYVEAEVIGSDVGDMVGRVYLRQQGTSVVHGLGGDNLYYRFPKRLAVVNPFFNGTRLFTPEVYRNGRLKDRPFVNTSWELILNQRDEQANKDINLQALTDIRLYIYYTDFTVF